MITNKYIWINRELLDLKLHDRRLALICRLGELMVEDGSIMEQDEKRPANKGYMCSFAGSDIRSFHRIAKELIESQVMVYDDENKTYKMNSKYVILPSSKKVNLKKYVRVSCSNYDKLFPPHFESRIMTSVGHLVRLALHVGFIDNSIRENIYCTDNSHFIHLGIDEVFGDYSPSNIKRVESELKNMTFKGKSCVEFYRDKMVLNPLLFNTSGIILRKKSENKPFISEGEEMTRLFLDKYGINYEPQKRFDGLVGVNGGQLSYDFFLMDDNILIECQGSQHYRFGDCITEEAFMIQREHDHRKWEYAKNHNITLIELPYWHYKNVEEYLKKFIKTLDKSTN